MELIVVITILVTVMAIAAPVLLLLTMSESRSVEQATNVLSAALARTRNEAIGQQRYRGLLLFRTEGSGRVGVIALVQTETPMKVRLPAEIWFDLDPGSDPVLLPAGVGAQITIGGGLDGSGQRIANGYIGFNAAWSTSAGRHLPGGVIAFDADGRLFVGTAGLVWRQGTPTTLGRFLFQDHNVPGAAAAEAEGSGLSASQLGFCLFPTEDYEILFGTSAWTDDFAYGQAERLKEQWLDANATPFVINRYNGTLIRGQ